MNTAKTKCFNQNIIDIMVIYFAVEVSIDVKIANRMRDKGW